MNESFYNHEKTLYFGVDPQNQIWDLVDHLAVAVVGVEFRQTSARGGTPVELVSGSLQE